MASTKLTIQDEVRLAHEHLISRLSGALTTPPPGVLKSQLPDVPLIDLSPSFEPACTLESRKQVASKIRAACVTTGFFQIINHGIPSSVSEGILKQAARFFHELTPAQKDELHIKHSELFRGYEPSGSTYVNPDDMTKSKHKSESTATNGCKGSEPAKLLHEGEDIKEETNGAGIETKEGFNWGYEPRLDPTGGDGKYVELDGSVPDPENPGCFNVWPREEDLPGFVAGVAAYYAAVLHLARHLFTLFALSLDLEEDYFDKLTTHPGGIGRLLWYPAQPGPSPSSEPSVLSAATNGIHDANTTNFANYKPMDNKDQIGNTITNGDTKSVSTSKTKDKLGLGAHTDYECFTLLLSSSNPGLEILFPPSPLTDNKPIWLPCPVREGTLTVNVADFLMRWTNGLYKSTIHRVISKPGSGERYSVPFFFSINYDAEVAALPERVVGVTNHGEMRAGEYILERLRATASDPEGENGSEEVRSKLKLDKVRGRGGF